MLLDDRQRPNRDGERLEGAFGARADDAAGTMWARKVLASPTHDVTTTVRFKVDSRTTALHMLRFRSVGNVLLVRVSINGSGKLVYRNEVAGVNRVSTTTRPTGSGNELSVRTFADGTTGHATVMLDGVSVAGLDLVENIGTDAIGRVTLGDETNVDVHSTAYDNLEVTG